VYTLGVPVRAGVNHLRLRVLEAPAAELPNGDKRPLMLAIGGLSVSLAPEEGNAAPRPGPIASDMRREGLGTVDREMQRDTAVVNYGGVCADNNDNEVFVELAGTLRGTGGALRGRCDER
jgi:hypothetical protein